MNEDDFIFQQCQLQQQGHRQIIYQKYQNQTSSLIPMTDSYSIQASQHIEPIADPLEANIVVVQPLNAKEKKQYPEEDTKAESNFLYNSQKSQETYREVEVHKKEDKVKKENLVFQFEQSEDYSLSPESSTRKLYKQSNRRRNKSSYQQQPPQKLLNQEISQSKVFQEEEDEYSDLEEQYEDVSYKKQLKSSTLNDLIIYPIPEGKMIRCLVIVTNNKFFAFENIFDLYLVQEKKPLLRAVKKKWRLNSTFDIFGKEKVNAQNIAYIRSNLSRTEYKLIKVEKEYGVPQKMSENPSSSAFSSDIIKVEPTQDNKQPLSTTEDEACFISYETNLLGLTQQRVNMLKAKKPVPKSDRFSKIKTAYEEGEYQRVARYSTRPAEKGSDGKLLLDFKQKNIMNSSRNMILESQICEAGVMFAKFSEDIYILNVMYPFNLLEGFFLGLCNLDRKPFVS